MNEKDTTQLLTKLVDGLKPWLEERVKAEVRDGLGAFLDRELRSRVESELYRKINAAIGERFTSVRVEVSAK